MDLVAAVNDEATLGRNLLASDMVVRGHVKLHAARGAVSASQAYNAALDSTEGETVIFAHQDVYFPPGWLGWLQSAIAEVNARDPGWALIAPTGICADGRHLGQVWSSSQNRCVGEPLAGPAPAQSFDELAIVMRRAAGLRFDAQMPGFHLYGTDIVQTALRRGLGAWICQMPLVHNDAFHDRLGEDYGDAHRYVRRKWRAALPLRTTVLEITARGLELPIHRARGWKSLGKRRSLSFRADTDPREISRRCGWETAGEGAGAPGAAPPADGGCCAGKKGQE